MKLSSSEIGQGLTEYALLFVFIAIAIIVILQLFGISVFDMWDFAVARLGEAFS